MDRLRSWPLLCVMSLLTVSLVAADQDGQVKRRLTPKEIEALPSENAGAGTDQPTPSTSSRQPFAAVQQRLSARRTAGFRTLRSTWR
jgi:hypothetical protein